MNSSKIILLLTTFLTLSCQRETTYDCAGASSPTDLILTNDCDTNMTVKLYEHTGIDNYRLIKSLEIERNDRQTTCLENEGPIADGLYLRIDDRTKLIKLKYGSEFKLNLCDSTFLIENIGPLN